MSSNNRRRQLPLITEMDMVPMIDIFLQLLIFFILTSAFTSQPGINVHLPKAVTAHVANKEPTAITITKGDHLYLGSRVVTLQELRTQLVPLSQGEHPLLIRADRQVAMGRVVEVWDLCRSLGIQQLNIATSSLSGDQTS